MTRIRGVRILQARCCGARYSAPNFLSMNFSASARWTDGWREDSLMPNDEGLRRCDCGRFILMRDLRQVDVADESELPNIQYAYLSGDLLPECIAAAEGIQVELAARLQYWRELNHPYRAAYREHRDAEEAATRAAWEVANLDLRTRWDKFLRRKAPSYSRPPDSPLTVPLFEPSEEQLQNMGHLVQLLARAKRSGRVVDPYMLVELHREQGQFGDARCVLQASEVDQSDRITHLFIQLIREEQPAPMRVRG
jgi:hypothetical protein